MSKTNPLGAGTVNPSTNIPIELRDKLKRTLAGMTLGVFAGVRPEELSRLNWSSIDLGAKRVTIDATASKVRRRRHVPLEEAAVRWLTLCHPAGPVLPRSARRRRRRIAEAAGITWHQDILRHTAASYLLALHGDAGRVSLWLGNSPGILLKHYRELVTPGDVERFWGISPGAALGRASAGD